MKVVDLIKWLLDHSNMTDDVVMPYPIHEVEMNAWSPVEARQGNGIVILNRKSIESCPQR